MFRLSAIWGLGLFTVFLVGCHRPYFMTELDYVHYNGLSNVVEADSEQEHLIPESAPRTVRDPKASCQWELTLQETLRFALANNKQIALLKNQPGEIGTQIELLLASFDANFEMGAAWRRTDRQNRTLFSSTNPAVSVDLFGGIDSISGPNLLSLSKRNAAGGLTRISYRLAYDRIDVPRSAFIAVNPAWTSEVEFRIEQPILQGAGVEFGRSPILVARANHEQAIKEFQTTVGELMRDVEIAYWQLYFVYKDLYSRQTGMKQALATWQKEKRRLDVGKGALPDVAQAREQFESFGVDRLEALGRILEQERQLRELLGLPPEDGRQIAIADDPTIAGHEPDWMVSVGEAMELRPELAGQRMAIRAAELEVFQQKNGLKPELSVGATWTISGLDNQFDQSIDRLTDNRFTDWTLSVGYRQPIGERAAHASVRRAELALSRERATLRDLEHTIVHQLHAAYLELVTSYEIIQGQRDRREAATIQLQAREKFYRQGKTTIDVLLESQTTFANALRDESQAIVRYNQALARWEFAKGTILINDNIILVEERPLLDCDGRVQCKDQWSNGKSIGLVPGKVLHSDAISSDAFEPLYPEHLLKLSGESNVPQVLPSTDAKPQEISSPVPDTGETNDQ